MPELNIFGPNNIQGPSPYPLTWEYIRYQATQRPNHAAVIDQGKVFSFDTFNRDINKMHAALDDLRLTSGQMVGVEFLPDAGQFSSFYFHWVKLLAFEVLGVATMSFARAEAPQMQEILGSLDLIMVFPDAVDMSTKRLHVMNKDWITRTMSGAPTVMSVHNDRYSNVPCRIIKSSGTTGSMKYMIRSVENQEHIYITAQFRGGFNHQSRFFATGGFSVSAFHAAAVTCIRAGGTCVYDTRQKTETALSSYDITHASFLVYSLMQMLDAITADYKKPSDLKILTIGSPISESVRRRLLSSLATQVSETYGTNESSTISTIDAKGEGVTLPGVLLETVDDDDCPVTGVPGWIRVRSAGCVKSYLNNPSATEEMFKDGWFYPGDIGILQDDQTFRLIGRADGLLNIRGLKFAPEGFEEQLMQALPVRDVCVLTLPDHENVAQVVVAVVMAPNENETEVTSKMQQMLPAVFGATRVVSVSHIPRTKTGKIERQTLTNALKKLPPNS